MIKKKLRQQKLLGFLLLILCAIMVFITAHGETIADRDGTAVFLLAPLGLYMIFTKKVIIL